MGKSMQNKFIIKDTREPDTSTMIINDYLEAKDYEIRREVIYPSGDYRFGDVIIERKTVEDFDSSFTDPKHHMWDQCQRMRDWANEEDGRYIYLFIIGDSGLDNKYGNINQKSRIGAVGSIMTRYHIPVIFLKDEYQFVLLMDKMYRNYYMGEFGKGRDMRYIPSQYGSFGEYILSGIPGISESRAEDILDDFYIEVNLVPRSSKITRPIQIKGIGKVLENKILEKVNLKNE